MVCPRCTIVLKQILENLAIAYIKLENGRIVLADGLKPEMEERFKDELNTVGFTIVNNMEAQLVSQVKAFLATWLSKCLDKPVSSNFSQPLQDELNKNYAAISRNFTVQEGISISTYWIGLRMEMAKQLLIQTDLPCCDIACSLGYSSLAHFSVQFKKYCGSSPRSFRNQNT